MVGGDLGAVELVLGRRVDEEDLGGVACAREGRVGPVAGEVVGVADDASPFDGAALHGVGGEGVGVLEVLGDIGGVECPVGAGVGADEKLVLGRVDGDDRAAHAVVDLAPPVVVASDDAVADGELLAGDEDALAQPTLALELGARERVETRAAGVVAGDEDRLSARARGFTVAPDGDGRLLGRKGGLMVPAEDVQLARVLPSR